MSLSQIEKELCDLVESPFNYSNFSKEEWQAMRPLVNDRSVVIKKSDKGLCVVVWDREDYIAETERQLGGVTVYKDVAFKENMLQGLPETSNKLFRNLKNKGGITEKQLKYFTIGFKRVTNLGKLYLLPEIYKRLFEVPGRPVTSNRGTPTEKVSEFLDSELKSVKQEGWSYIKDFGDFIKKLKNIDHIPQDAIMVTADVVGLYTSIPHDAGLEALRKAFDNRENKKISTDDFTKMTEFVLKNNYFEFNGKVKTQIWRTAIGTKFAPPYAFIFMDQVETEFLKTQEHKPLVCFRYIDDVFFIWTQGKEMHSLFLEDLNTFHPNIKFSHEVNKESIRFFDLNFSLSDGNISTDL